MIIGCPSCATRYRIGPLALGRPGRDVRCAKCGHRWHQLPPAERVAPIELLTHAAEPAPSSAAVLRMIPTAMLYAVFGSVGMALPLLVLNFVTAKLPAGVVALQLTLVPMLTYAFALVLRIDKVNALKLAGLGVGLSAVLVVLLPEASLPSPDMAVWVLFSLLTPLCYAMANVLIPLLRPPQSSSLAISAAKSLTGAIYMDLVMLATGE